jgi:hypothetical protein
LELSNGPNVGFDNLGIAFPERNDYDSVDANSLLDMVRSGNAMELLDFGRGVGLRGD